MTEEDDSGEEVEKSITRFPVLSVFDISQTEPIDGVPDNSTLTRQLVGVDDLGIVDTLSDHLNAQGWTIKRQNLPGTKNGYTKPEERLVVLEENLSAEHAAKTMIHETAHIELGHIEDMTEYLEHRGLRETEAESVAYVVAGMLGIDTAAYSIGYIARWSEENTDLIKSTATRVLRAADTIAGILSPEEEAEGE